MKAEVQALVEELKRLRKQGVDRVPVSEEALNALRQRISTASLAGRQRAVVLESIPEAVRSATADDFDRMIADSRSPAGAAALVSKGKPSPSKFGRPPAIALPEGDKQTRWNALRDLALNCRVGNEQVKEGKKVVFGVGNLDADIFLCGEAPGAEEEIQGEPFVGPAGQLLDKMIKAAGLRREDVYIANILTWRPAMPTSAGNRPPNADEIAFCFPYLRAQLEIVKPKLIVALGVTAAKGLLGENAFKSLREIKGQWRDFEGTPVMPTYHPSYLLHNSTNRDKRGAWEDWLKVMEKAGLPISDKQRGYFL